MRQNTQNKRLRSRSRKGVSPLARVYDSNGPDVKVRGSAQQVAEKYVQLSRDAQSAGDRVMAENYMQHAEHYYRILAAAQANGAGRDDRDDDRDDAWTEDQPREIRDDTGRDREERHARGGRNGAVGRSAEDGNGAAHERNGADSTPRLNGANGHHAPAAPPVEAAAEVDGDAQRDDEDASEAAPTSEPAPASEAATSAGGDEDDAPRRTRRTRSRSTSGTGRTRTTRTSRSRRSGVSGTGSGDGDAQKTDA